MAQDKLDSELVELERRLIDKMENLREETYQEFENLRKEMYEEFTQVRSEIHRLDKRFTIMSLIIIFLIIFLNQNSLELILKILGVPR